MTETSPYVSRAEAHRQYVASEQRVLRLQVEESKRHAAALRKIEQAWATRQRRFRRLYLTVPCSYCGAERGQECDVPLNTTATMHSARVVACQTGLALPAANASSADPATPGKGRYSAQENR